RGSPITPVDARNTSRGRQPTAPAAASATWRAPSNPALPVNALALPLLTTRARAPASASALLHHSTGADAVLDLVNTPAAWVFGASTARSTSVRSRYLIPARPVAKRTPDSGGRAGKVRGAKGETPLAAPAVATLAFAGARTGLRAPLLLACVGMTVPIC